MAAVDVEIIKTNTVIVDMIMTNAMVMVAAMIVGIMVVAVADMVVVVAMAAKIPREIARTMAMAAAPMRLVRYVARLGILRSIAGRDTRKTTGAEKSAGAAYGSYGVDTNW
jgi:hypothetical protein